MGEDSNIVSVKASAARFWVNLLIYVGAAVVCCGLTYWLYALSWENLRVPFTYGSGDELSIGIQAKTLIEFPWVFHNPRLGMPFGSELFNYPAVDVFNYAVLKLLGLITNHFGLVLNLFFLVTFPATLLCTLYVLRQFDMGYPAALFGSFLYTFLPYHFMRGVPHMFLAAYEMVPLVVLLMFRLFCGCPSFFERKRAGRFRFNLSSPRTLAALVICVLLGSSGIGYYAFFACCLLLVAGGTAAILRRLLAPFLSSFITIALISATVLLCVTPYILYSSRNAALRQPASAEIYGLKIVQLLLPMSGHRYPPFAQLKAHYYQDAPLVNENDASSLGLVGSVGFLFLLGWAACRLMGGRISYLNDRDQTILSAAALLTIASVFLATIGGFGSLFALLVYPQIRGYNRISVFIAFFALLAVALLIDRSMARWRTKHWSYLTWCLGLALLLLVGIWDQTSPLFIPDYGKLCSAYKSDESFVRAIESTLLPGSMIFQLPYTTYPDASRYDPAKGYLHSRTLRWSYGAVQEGRSDLWQRAVSNKPTAEMVADVASAGFAGIYLDRKFYDDKAARIKGEIAAVVHVPPLVSSDSRLVFYNLEFYKRSDL